MKLALLAALLVCAGCTEPVSENYMHQSPLGEATKAVITRVSDGDTYKAQVGSETITLRLLSADSPETHNPHLLDPNGHEIKQCGGIEATQYAKHALQGQTVTLTADPTQADKDRYGRYLRYVTLDEGDDFSTDLVRAGLAKVYVFGGKPAAKYGQIADAQKQAQVQQVGIWGPLCAGK